MSIYRSIRVQPIPSFTSAGLLPPGDHPMTFDELMRSILVLGVPGPDRSPVWDTSWRKHLVSNLRCLVEQLWSVGIEQIFIDGSFAEDKDHPNDIDGYFECDLERLKSGELTAALNALDPFEVWTWSPSARQPYRCYPKKQLPMWHQYRIELYPHVPGLLTGLRDRHGNELEFPSAFRQSRRDGQPRGIVRMLKDDRS